MTTPDNRDGLEDEDITQEEIPVPWYILDNPDYKETPENEMPIPEIPEYDFETGLKKAMTAILEKLRTQDLVLVAINGSTSRVGKSTLANAIEKTLIEMKIPARKLMDNFIHPETASFNKQIQTSFESKKMVIILEQALFGGVTGSILDKIKERIDREAQQICASSGYENQKIDLWIGIYRPDRPFKTSPRDNTTFPVADFVIRNDKAHN